MPDPNRSYAEFRLNVEQQDERASDLLRRARAGAAHALARFSAAPTLGEARYLIAKELRFDSWAALERHVGDMTRARAATSVEVPDGDLGTLHVRCGGDLKVPLREAGFRGDYYEHSYPYLMGPVRDGADCLRQRARFIVDCYAAFGDPPLEFDAQLRVLEDAERVLHESADYERVVLWFEHDCYDQLTLVRLLAHYALARRPARLELVSVRDFPGARRFIGLGELPPEALRLLWATRSAVVPAQLQLGLDAWRALASPDPRALAALMRGDTPALPLLAPALHRHLAELPSIVSGLSLTEELALGLLAARPQSLAEMAQAMARVADPLPGQGDWNVRRRVLDMEAASERVYTRSEDPGREGNRHPPWTDVLAITALGRAVLLGERDFRTLDPPPRWVGGVEVGAGNVDWRWDAKRREAVRR
jgi:hypothetical protein